MEKSSRGELYGSSIRIPSYVDIGTSKLQKSSLNYDDELNFKSIFFIILFTLIFTRPSFIEEHILDTYIKISLLKLIPCTIFLSLLVAYDFTSLRSYAANVL
jgi:hypothetical protein